MSQVQLDEEDSEELEAAQELDADKDAFAADKEADVGDADAGRSILVHPERLRLVAANSTSIRFLY